MKDELLDELGVWDALEKEEEKRITIVTERAKFRKYVTIIKGFDKNTAKAMMKELKHAFACGGTIKDGAIILQGDHKNKVKAWLIKKGYKEENIEV